MQRFRKALFQKYLEQGMDTQHAGPIARSVASWQLAMRYCPNGDLGKFHRREIDRALIEASRHRRFMQSLLATPADHRINSQPFMPMRCKGGMVQNTRERARLVANDVRSALLRARYHRNQIAMTHF